jgi:hypothetical protein
VWCRGRWFQKTDKGFSIRSHFRCEEYRIEDIQKTSLSNREIQPFFASGEFLERRLTFFFPNQKVTMQTLFRPDRSDELAPFVELITEQQWKRAEKMLNDGNSISGQNWTLFSDRLVFSEQPTSCQVKFDEIDAFEIERNDLLLWKKGNVFPVSRLSFESENVWLLFRYLTEKTTQKSDLPLENFSKSNLGRFIDSFYSTIYVILFWTLTCSIIYSFHIIPDPWSPAVLTPAFFFSILYLLLVVPLGLNGWNVHVNVWEHGFQCIHWFGTKTGFYENIRSFRMNKTVQYANGCYIGTWRSLTITDFQGRKTRFFKNDRSANDGVLGFLHKRLTKIVYARFLEQLNNEGYVQWTDEIRIMKNGIEIKSSGLFGGRKEPVFISYDELQIGSDVNSKGLFLMWGKGTRNTPVKDIIMEPTIAAQLGLRKGRVFVSNSIPDFLPGLMLLEYYREH